MNNEPPLKEFFELMNRQQMDVLNQQLALAENIGYDRGYKDGYNLGKADARFEIKDAYNDFLNKFGGLDDEHNS